LKSLGEFELVRGDIREESDVRSFRSRTKPEDFSSRRTGGHDHVDARASRDCLKRARRLQPAEAAGKPVRGDDHLFLKQQVYGARALQPGRSLSLFRQLP
jgi:hypothetical protein